MTGLGRTTLTLIVTTMVMVLHAGVAHADVHGAVDDDTANQLWDCDARAVPFGDTSVDTLRCLTFRFSAPSDVRRAVLYLDIDAPTNSLQDTDSLVVAVGEPFDECAWAQGGMDGCVVVHGGFSGGERSLVVDLLDVTCDPAAPPIDADRQDAIRSQLESGVVHVMLQDDTSVRGGWLDINGASAPACGTSADAVPAALRQGTTTVDGADDGGGVPVVPILVAAVAVAAIGVATTTVGQRTRVRRAQRRVHVTRVPGIARVELEPSAAPNGQPTLALGVRAWPDEKGTQTMSEGAR